MDHINENIFILRQIFEFKKKNQRTKIPTSICVSICHHVIWTYNCLFNTNIIFRFVTRRQLKVSSCLFYSFPLNGILPINFNEGGYSTIHGSIIYGISWWYNGDVCIFIIFLLSTSTHATCFMAFNRIEWGTDCSYFI